MLVSTKLPPGIALFPGRDVDTVYSGDVEIGCDLRLRGLVSERPDNQLDASVPKLLRDRNRIGASSRI
jgi:hypothetical protein